ncbi:hypothetical protein V8E54_008678 [Elaphomyces granulatus]
MPTPADTVRKLAHDNNIEEATRRLAGTSIYTHTDEQDVERGYCSNYLLPSMDVKQTRFSRLPSNKIRLATKMNKLAVLVSMTIVKAIRAFENSKGGHKWVEDKSRPTKGQRGRAEALVPMELVPQLEQIRQKQFEIVDFVHDFSGCTPVKDRRARSLSGSDPLGFLEQLGPASVPSYKLSRQVRTVTDLWKEWTGTVYLWLVLPFQRRMEQLLWRGDTETAATERGYCDNPLWPRDPGPEGREWMAARLRRVVSGASHCMPLITEKVPLNRKQRLVVEKVLRLRCGMPTVLFSKTVSRAFRFICWFYYCNKRGTSTASVWQISYSPAFAFFPHAGSIVLERPSLRWFENSKRSYDREDADVQAGEIMDRQAAPQPDVAGRIYARMVGEQRQGKNVVIVYFKVALWFI